MGNLSTEFKFPSPKLKLPFPYTPDEYKIIDKFWRYHLGQPETENVVTFMQFVVALGNWA